ncbi:eukaryotic translation initiation factor 4E, putative [Entamoeba histolytica HM-3:IMSS]|uniref:Eukaryotic translation initiation factor 4E, putative n=5 Tax=Entamoeba histolytica TaxID=5759 RepID=B1N2F5_ENTH1|nr:eukaryotic translation initiation factor 4E, putative [Entamoeba histolytica HM-1:IMSS]EMD46624.1 eukaryotic translation initiation factor 4E, putative [Entamoeba histolytica KU27]EMS17265.1 eukaryotic translation initiation factor 4E, putative [Entamoeba histolytica HM-3:IMSS]ENY59902.1 eukaryotic translation initiation factor 4E, putative [Entamoeba histolytica HM-1:IMSS-A]GAT91431.1 eukaryotic translation initiation factor 4e putative [Entamoeba histolytica]EDS89850.1 eukaryotic translat|eukprot:XP_001913353.1 eukaryotic translation initiation factor 4E, putative [Entamoeba histolytica HM-1:IMSS]
MTEEVWKIRNYNEEKHQLSDCWELWVDEMSESFSSSELNARSIAIFQTVEEFWSVYSSMSSLQVMPKGVDVYLLKSGNSPNNGQKIILSFSEKVKSEWDLIYQQIVLLCVGSTISYYTSLVGISYSVGSSLKISIWYSGSNETMLSDVVRDINLIPNMVEHTTRISIKN